MILLGGFGRSARTRGWAVLDGLRSKELNCLGPAHIPSLVTPHMLTRSF